MTEMVRREEVADTTLEETLGTVEGGMTLFEITENLIKMLLFSQYPQRKKYAQQLLNEMYQTPVQIKTERSNGLRTAYIGFNNVPKYFVVRQLRPEPYLEEVPNEEEMKQWPE